MKNVLHTVLLLITFLFCTSSFTDKVVIYGLPPDEEHNITNITHDNVIIHGRRVTSTDSGMITAKYAENIVYK